MFAPSSAVTPPAVFMRLFLAAALVALAAPTDSSAQTDAPPPAGDTEATTSVAAGVDAEAPSSPEIYRREQRARFYGILVPGTGHLYAGETGRGALLLGLGVGVPVATSLMTGVSQVGCNSRSGCDPVGGKEAVFLGAMAVGMAAWVYSWVDADNAVRRVEAGRRLQAAPTVVSGGAGMAPGLAMRVRL